MKRKPESNSAAVATTPAANGTHRSRPARRGPGITPGSREANKLAIAILDVLAGACLPAEAAAAVGVSLPRYYQLEQRVLDALVKACEPRGKGPRTNPERQRLKLERQVARLTQECSRQQALVRAAHRTIGLAPAPAKPAAKDGAARRKRQRKPTVRALSAARRLRAAAEEQAAVEAAATAPAPVSSPDTSLPFTVTQEGGSLS